MLKHDAQIMIVDDSKLVRLAMTKLFQSLGYHNIMEAADGVEAVNLHAKQRPDLILLDIVMPNMRGDEALALIRATDTTTPIIMLSSVSKESEIAACRSYGITEFVVKPIVSEGGKAVLAEQLERLG
jgi:CheY-like chemotaxis protein